MARRNFTTPTERRARGESLRQLRQSRRLSQEALAAAVGITPQQVSKYERGQSVIGPTWADRFARALGADLSAIYAAGQGEGAGVSETPARFTGDGAAVASRTELADVFALAEARLRGEQRAILRRFIVALVEEQAARS